MPTSSPRAWAGDDITIPAPMVTAKAAAILSDIAFSIPVAPLTGSISPTDPVKEVGLAVSRTYF